VHLLLAVKAAQTERRQPDDMRALDGIIDHVAHRLYDFRVGDCLFHMVFGTEQEMQRHHPGLG
jgi:hypothetical protein